LFPYPRVSCCHLARLRSSAANISATNKTNAVT
jgi:hypothetical protein